MIEMLQPKFIDVEIVINDSILLTQTKILFGYEVESDRQIVEIELNADYNCTSLIKFGQEKEVSLNELAKTNLNKRLEVEINGKIIMGIIEFTKEMKAEKFIKQTFFSLHGFCQIIKLPIFSLKIQKSLEFLLFANKKELI